MTRVKLTGRVLYNDKDYKPGDIINDIDNEAAERLVKGNVAFFVGHHLNEELTPVSSTVEEEPVEDVLKANFTLEELKEEADTFDLKYPKSITKPEMIKLIIEEGKAQHYLDMLED